MNLVAMSLRSNSIIEQMVPPANACRNFGEFSDKTIIEKLAKMATPRRLMRGLIHAVSDTTISVFEKNWAVEVMTMSKVTARTIDKPIATSISNEERRAKIEW